ncbi:MULTISPECIES: hypothetical protein [Bradyrhizobium]|uniref:hypothetical protein n=1 Tax=Bradyrhizobium TaxID=374 RepID=UPI001CD4FAAF|nr:MULTISPECIES: hypothetical protein [unclassified Bradyrhizobium]MCA1475838.1 hypothetical protein [Bradyrhizobium sp. NBAIM08]MCA1539449.1 hypothetical protein [Bradyrhizobium sp. NBAIM32]UWU86276.1 hypothetical protein N2605_07430 [Bradyrhizobium sp. CB1024]
MPRSIAASGPPGSRDGLCRTSSLLRSIAMMDLLMLALGFFFFALAIGYTYACERL